MSNNFNGRKWYLKGMPEQQPQTSGPEILRPIIDSSEVLLQLAENKQWGQFQRKLSQREALISILRESIDIENPPEELREGIYALQKLNQQVCDLVERERQVAGDALIALKKGDKAKSFYRDMK